MPIFEIQGPDGVTYEVDAPNQDAAIGAFQSEATQSAQAPQDFHGVSMDAEAIAEARRAAGKQVGQLNNPFSAATHGANAGMFFNFDDELGAALMSPFRATADAVQGKGFDLGRAYNFDLAVNREVQDQLREKQGAATLVGEVAGGVAQAGALTKGGLTLLDKAKPTLTSLAGRGAAEGAIYGAAYGAGAGEGVPDKVSQAAQGGVVGAAMGGATGAVTRGLVSNRAKQAIPSKDQLQSAAQEAYKQADQAGVIFTKNGTQRLYQDIVADFADFGFLPKNQPGAAAALKELSKMSSDNVTLKGLESLRKAVSNSFIPGNKPNNALIAKMINHIDNFVGNPQAPDVLMGDAQAGSQALSKARELWSRLSKLDKVDTAFEKATRRAATSGSGANAENAIRQNFDKLLDKPRGFSQAEQAAIRKVAEGGPVRNGMRLAGKFAPTGVVSAIPSIAAPTLLGPVGAAVPLAGLAAKAGSDAMTKAAAKSVQQLIRNGGKAGEAPLRSIEQLVMQLLSHSPEMTVNRPVRSMQQSN